MRFRIIFSVILFFVAINLSAQSYVPFPTDSARWKMSYRSSASQCLALLAEFQDTIGGDTVIGMTTYQKIYQSGVSYDQMCYILPLGYIGCIREDLSKHIYLRLPQSNSDTLIYDFNLTVGDTVKGYVANCDTIIVDSIDSVLIQSNYRKRFNCSSHTTSFCFANCSIIEGIGGTQGLLCPMGNYESFFYLDCFNLYGQTIYPDTITSCPLIVAGIEHHSEILFSIFPNPSKDFVKIQFNQNIISTTPNFTIELSDVTGKIIRTEDYPKVENSINIEKGNLPDGIYFFKISNSDKSLVRGKIIFE